MGQVQYACALTSIEEYGCMTYTYCWGGGPLTLPLFYIIQCVHEQSLTGICIFPVFYLLPMDHLCINR